MLSTDPNADQLAVAELQEDGQWKVFTGNELATLFGCGGGGYLIAGKINQEILM